MKKMIQLLIMAVCASSLMSCANHLVKKPLSPDMLGKLTIENVTVTKLEDVDDAAAPEAVKKAVEAELAKKDKGTTAANMKITLEEWATPGTSTAAKLTGKLLGSSSKVKALIVITAANGDLLSEYRAVADYSEGGLLGKTTSVSFNNPQERLLNKFVYFALDPLY